MKQETYITILLCIVILLLLLNIVVRDYDGCTTEEMTCYHSDTPYPFMTNTLVHEQCRGLIFSDYDEYCGWKNERD